MKHSLLAGTASWAHLLGRAKPASAKRAEEDEDEKKHAVTEDKEKGDGDDEGDSPKDGKGKRAEDPKKDEESDEGDERDEDEEGDDKAKKGKRAKRASEEDGEDDDEEGDDGSDGADMRKKGARGARMRERARCAAIFADAAAGKNPALAAQLAFGTDLPRSQAVSVLRAGGLAVAPRRNTLDERMAAVKTPPVGAGDAAATGGQDSLAARIIAAGQKARGKTA